jgi:aryl-alcohol dehydrogenase-like predicted oxidoreductase
METRPLGPGAPAVACIGFGGMPLSIDGRPDEAQGIRTIHAVLDGGATLIDTADVYCMDDDDIGHNERLIAKALASWSGNRDAIIVATRGGLTRPRGSWQRDASPKHLRAACDKSLKALGVQTIDLYQLHAPDSRVPLADSVGTLAELKKAGKIRRVGLSNVSIEEIEEANAIVPITSVQNRLNPFFREDIVDGVVDYCGQAGIGYLAYSPVGGGRLNLRLPGHPALAPIAKRHGASAHAVVIAWLMALGRTVIPIPGARTPEHALDSLGAAGLLLEPQERAAIDNAMFSRG